MHPLFERFTPHEFQVDGYGTIFGDDLSGIGAQWVVKFLQQRDRGWEDFTGAELLEFYRANAKGLMKDDGFPYGRMTSDRWVNYNRHSGVTVFEPNEILLLGTPWKRGHYPVSSTVITVLPGFVRRLIAGHLLIADAAEPKVEPVPMPAVTPVEHEAPKCGGPK